MIILTNEAIPQIMATLGLNYGPAIRASEYFRREVGKVNASLIQMQKQAQLSDLRQMKASMDGLTHSLRQTAATRAADASRARADAYKREALSAQELAQKQYHLSQQLGHRLGWFTGGLIFYGGMQVFRGIASAITEVELGMVEIKKVMNDAAADFGKLQQELIDLSVEYGVAVKDTLEVATLWARAGYKSHELLELVKTSLLGISVAQLSATDSVRLLISGMKQFNMTADESGKILDAINEISNNYSVDAKNLLEALSVSGQVAKNAGIDFHTLLGYITALSEATGRAGRELGNSIKSIISFSQRPKAIEVFEQLGVHVVNAEGNYRNFVDVFTELSEKWTGATLEQQETLHKLAQEMGLAIEMTSELTDVEKTAVSSAAANMFRRNMFISLMENYTTALAATETGTKSLGSAEKEMAMFMESAYKKMEQLKASATALAVEIGQAGLLTALKATTDELRWWVQWFTELPEPIKHSVIVFGGLITALGMVNLASRTFVGIGVAGALKSWAAAATGAEAATMRLGTALGVMAKNPVFLTVAGITALVGALRYYNKHSEQVIQKTIDSMNAHQQAAEQIEGKKKQLEALVNQYEALSEKTDLTSKEQERLNRVIAELVAVLPAVIEGYDAAGNAVLTLANVNRVAADETARLTAEMKLQAEAASEIAKARIPFLKEEKAKAEEDVKRYTEALRSPFPRGRLLSLEPKGYRQLWAAVAYDDEQARQRLSDLAEESMKKYAEASRAVAEAEGHLRAGEVFKAAPQAAGVSPDDPWTREDFWSKPSAKTLSWAAIFSGSLSAPGEIILEVEAA